MKRKLAIVALVLCSALGLLAENGVVSSSNNPLQVALLHWYPANQAQTAFQAGGYPIATAFDGQSIWVANAGSDSNNINEISVKRWCAPRHLCRRHRAIRHRL